MIDPEPTPQPRLFHFSEEPNIGQFVPRVTDAPRPEGMEWLNGPLVWAITEQRQAAYLFPRDCPRILLWLTPDTTPEDRAEWWGTRNAEMIACVEWRWLDAIRSAELHRYEFAANSFQPVDGDWTWVTKDSVEPISVEPCGDLLEALAAQAVELRIMPSLAPLAGVWSTSLHASGIRLKNAHDWPR